MKNEDVPLMEDLGQRLCVTLQGNLEPVTYEHLSGISQKLNVQATDICLFLRFPVRVKEG